MPNNANRCVMIFKEMPACLFSPNFNSYIVGYIFLDKLFG